MFKHPMGKPNPVQTSKTKRIPPQVIVAFSVLLTTAAMFGNGDADLGPATAGTRSASAVSNPFSKINGALSGGKGG
jgi:hypothetical protein